MSPCNLLEMFDLTKSNFVQHYTVGSKAYSNIFHAFHENLSNNDFCYYDIDPDFYTQIQNRELVDTTPDQIRSLIVDQLRTIRKNYNHIRLLLSGGTDSFTILRLCVENNIFIDETVTQLSSTIGNIKTDIEFLPGIKYAKKFCPQHIGKVSVLQNSISNFNAIQKNWFTDSKILRGNYLSPRWLFWPNVINQLEKIQDTKQIILTGIEKPLFFKDDNKIYSCVFDSTVSEFMDIPNVYHVFLDKNNPDLLIAQISAMLKYKKYFQQGLNSIYTLPDNQYQNIRNDLGLYSTGRLWLDKGLLGKTGSGAGIKDKYFHKELEKLGYQNINQLLDKQHLEIYNLFKNKLHHVQWDNKRVKSTGRFSRQKLLINNNSTGPIIQS